MAYHALTYPSNLPQLIEDGAGGMIFSFYDRPDSQKAIPAGSVQLYLPNNLRNPMDVNWTQTSNQAAVGQAVQDEGNLALNFLKGLTQQAAVTFADFTNTKSVIEQSQRKISNPYIAMTFESIGFRKFNMEFKFTPHSGHESHLIDQIIKKFRKIALPGGGAFLGYPGEVLIEYVGHCKRWLPKFKPSVITALDVNYTGQGFYAGMVNGFPAETVLTLEFTENVLVFREDITVGESF